MKKCPVSFIMAPLGWLKRLRARKRKMKELSVTVESLDAHALRTWREGHHTFFLMVQGIILNLEGFKRALANQNFPVATHCLDRAATILLGSGAAMRIAGDVDQNSYANAVVPAMLRAHAKFSGSDSHDHEILIKIYRKISALPSPLPPDVQRAYNRFMGAVSAAVGAHVYVCRYHGGAERTSTGSGSSTKVAGIETLSRIGAHWLGLLKKFRKLENPSSDETH
jgi:hypothetical protein